MKRFLLLFVGCLLSLPLYVQAEDDDRDKPATVPPPPKEVTDLYRQISPKEIKENPFKLIGQDWMLISAGNEEKYKPKLEMYGHKSGRNTDKLKEAGFTALSLKPGMAYKEARMILQCKKIYADRTRAECWLPPRGETSSPSDGAHKLYFGEILSVWVKKQK